MKLSRQNLLRLIRGGSQDAPTNRQWATGCLTATGVLKANDVDKGVVRGVALTTELRSMRG